MSRPVDERSHPIDTYLLLHRHPDNYAGSPEAAAAWEAWFDKLGEALVDKGNAVLDGRGAVGEPGSVRPLGGYTIINAADHEEATQLARGCPALQAGGAVEVGRLTPVPGRLHPARTF